MSRDKSASRVSSEALRKVESQLCAVDQSTQVEHSYSIVFWQSSTPPFACKVTHITLPRRMSASSSRGRATEWSFLRVPKSA